MTILLCLDQVAVRCAVKPRYLLSVPSGGGVPPTLNSSALRRTSHGSETRQDRHRVETSLTFDSIISPYTYYYGNIPSELICGIAEHCGRPSLLGLWQLSRSLRVVLTPWIFEHITIGFNLRDLDRLPNIAQSTYSRHVCCLTINVEILPCLSRAEWKVYADETLSRTTFGRVVPGWHTRPDRHVQCGGIEERRRPVSFYSYHLIEEKWDQFRALASEQRVHTLMCQMPECDCEARYFDPSDELGHSSRCKSETHLQVEAFLVGRLETIPPQESWDFKSPSLCRKLNRRLKNDCSYEYEHLFEQGKAQLIVSKRPSIIELRNKYALLPSAGTVREFQDLRVASK